MSNQIQTAYINALLADAAYVDANLLATDLSKKLTQSQADYLTANFQIASSINTPDIPLLGSGFDATVFRGRAGTEYAGQVFVSARGTEPNGGTGSDLWGADADLAINVAARTQIIDMVNWWLKGTAAKGAQVAQIKWDPLRVKPGTITTLEPGLARAATATGTGELVGVSSVQVNGHSLGGHLASAFARIFGGNNYQPGSVRVESISSFNSAGFNGTKSEAFFAQIQELLGTGLNSFAPVSSLQTNYYAANGINLTTNDWWFTQMGSRTPLYQEEGTGSANHSMYRLTDLLALGNTLSQLDSNLSIEELNALSKAGSNRMAASYEGILDGVRRMLLGANTAATPASDSAEGANRSTYHANLKALTDSAAFKALATSGKVTFSVASAALASSAKADFGAFLSLNALSPIVLSTGNDAAATAALQAAHPSLYTAWHAEVLMGAGSAARMMVLFGASRADALDGGGFADRLYGGAGHDTLDGKGGADHLEGGTGTDTYRFSSSFGKDTVVDADGLGTIEIDGQTLGTAKGSGQHGLRRPQVRPRPQTRR